MILETITSISLYIADKLAEKFIQDRFTKWEEKFKDPIKEQLTEIIYKTQDEFLKKYPDQKKYEKDEAPFWASQIIIDELLNYKYYDKYVFSDTIEKLKENKNIVIPSPELLNDFIEIFKSNAERDEKLKEIEIEIGYKEKIFNNSAKLEQIIQLLEKSDEQPSTINNTVQIKGDSNIVYQLSINEDSGIFSDLGSQLISINAEYKRQLDICEENINNLKPQTALDWLQKLEGEIEKNPNTTNILKSNLFYLEALCYEMLQESKKAWELYIKAYTLNKSLFFKERAAFSYFYLKGIDSSLKLADELLEEDENNPYGWFIKSVNNQEPNSDFFDFVPGITWNNLKFKKLIFAWSNNLSNPQIVKLVVDSINIIELEYNLNKLNREEFYSTNFYFNIALIKFFYETKVVFLNKVIQTNELIFHLIRLTDKLLQTLNKSEISENFAIVNFYNIYFRIIEKGAEKELLGELKTNYKNLNNTNPQILLQYLILLFQFKEYDLIQEEIKSYSGVKSEDLLHLSSFSYLEKRELEKAKSAFLNYIEAIEKIHEWNIINLLSIVDYFPYTEFINQLIEKINIKTSANQFLEKLLLVYFNCTVLLNKDELLNKIEEIRKENEFEHLKFYVANCYFKIQEYKSCIDYLNTFIDKENESAELYLYIHCLAKTKKDHVELLRLLKYWRINFSFDFELHRIESELRRQIPDLEEIEKIAENVLLKVPYNEYFLNLYFLTVEKLGRKEKINSYLNIIKDRDFENISIAINISGVLLRCHYFQEGIDIIYKYAKDKENIQIREFYFTSTSTIPTGFLIEYKKVETGHFVKYKLKDKFKTIHITEETFNNKPWAKKLLDKSRGDKIYLDFGQIEILRIMNKYLALNDEILESFDEIDEGYKIESFKLPDSEDIKKINEYFIKNFGAKEEERNRQIQNIINEYHSLEKSFSELCIFLNQGDWVKTYNHLTTNNGNGFNSAPSYLFQKFNLENKKILLDPTSIMLFFSLSKEFDLNFPDRFIIPESLIFNLTEAIRTIEIEPNSEMSLQITTKTVYPILYPKDLKKIKLNYYGEIIEWIQKNCDSVKNEKKLDLIMNLENNKNDPFFNSVIDIATLNTEEDYILISDDLFYYRFFPPVSGKILNTELFLFQHFQNKQDQISEFLLKRKYLGISIDRNILLSEFYKKLAQKDNEYLQCLININIKNYAKPEIMYECFGFLKLLAAKPVITPEVYMKEALNVLVHLFKGMDVSSPKFIIAMKLKIRLDYKILGYYADYTLAAFSDAMNILNTNKPV